MNAASGEGRKMMWRWLLRWAIAGYERAHGLTKTEFRKAGWRYAHNEVGFLDPRRHPKGQDDE